MGMMEVEERRLAGDEDNNVGPRLELECSICLEAASEPVVTLCGHLYCWPCMFRWLNSRHHGSARCPVCKAAVSEDHLVPLYGRGMDTTSGGPRLDDDDGMDMEYYQQGSWESNAECLLGGMALAVLLPRRLHLRLRLHLRYGGERAREWRQQMRRLQQLWVFLLMLALLCFLLL